MSREEFGRGVNRCVDEISQLLPDLAERFDVMVVVSAFAQHVGGALRLLLRRRMCDARSARLVLHRIETAAFADSLSRDHRLPRA
ncbi:MAG TPA: hypothetical protein VMT29_22065 [Steroidobacteraceae bacterium]|nr:hypothetical protein [Steroidobacteraceae bacterium]